jgi:hypothetical protein
MGRKTVNAAANRRCGTTNGRAAGASFGERGAFVSVRVEAGRVFVMGERPAMLFRSARHKIVSNAHLSAHSCPTHGFQGSQLTADGRPHTRGYRVGNRDVRGHGTPGALGSDQPGVPVAAAELEGSHSTTCGTADRKSP